MFSLSRWPLAGATSAALKLQTKSSTAVCLVDLMFASECPVVYDLPHLFFSRDCWKERMRVNSAMKAFHQTLSTLAYLKRLTTVMTDNYWLIALGLVITGANSALSVARTFSMGSLLDSVATKNRPEFLHGSWVFLIVSLVSGVASAFDGTVFRLIGTDVVFAV
jgi:hypothetical protein